MQKVLAPAALVILYVLFAIVGNNFFTWDTAENILQSAYYIGFMAFGVTFIIITGGIDLSLGTVMMCSALLGAYTFKLGLPLIVSVIITILVGIIFGVTQLFSFVAAGIYEIGLGVMVAGIVLFVSILLYNIAIRFLPWLISLLGNFLGWICGKIKTLFFVVRRECYKL